uniref:Uncharacterized protein n=1 Tax=Lepeophtheirus salmonis TaxID=72036 RepID=A0A0K2UUB1_LEPSM
MKPLIDLSNTPIPPAYN